MNWQDYITPIFEVCIIPLLGILVKFLVDYLKKKSDEAIGKTDNELAKKYIEMLTQTVTTCVIATNQTYVNALKEKDLFDIEAQKYAFNETYTNILNILSDDCKEYLTQAFGDLETYIRNCIEAEVKNHKQ